MYSFWVILISATCLVLFYLYYNSPIIENLRIQGSHDLRGDPIIIPHNEQISPWQDPSAIPWNNGGSSPIFNRNIN